MINRHLFVRSVFYYAFIAALFSVALGVTRTGLCQDNVLAKTPKIVAVIEPVRLLLIALTIPADQITSLLRADQDVHNFELSPSASLALKSATVIVTSSGVEINDLLVRNAEYSKKLISIGDASERTVHGWLSPAVLRASMVPLQKSLPQITDEAVTKFIDQLDTSILRTRNTLAHSANGSACNIIADHGFVTDLSQDLGCKTIKILRTNPDSELTLRVVPELRKIKKEYPDIIFIGSNDSSPQTISLFEKDLQIPTHIIYENGHGEESFFQYFDNTEKAFMLTAQ